MTQISSVLEINIVSPFNVLEVIKYEVFGFALRIMKKLGSELGQNSDLAQEINTYQRHGAIIKGMSKAQEAFCNYLEVQTEMLKSRNRTSLDNAIAARNSVISARNALIKTLEAEATSSKKILTKAFKEDGKKAVDLCDIIYASLNSVVN